jgi:hypothetical protein
MEIRNKIAAVPIVLLFTKNNKGARTKATRYQHFAKKNFNEMIQSVVKRTVTIIHIKLQSNTTIKGCFIFENVSEGLKRNQAKNRTVIIHMIGSSGRSVESEELKLYSIDHGKEKISR